MVGEAEDAAVQEEEERSEEEEEEGVKEEERSEEEESVIGCDFCGGGGDAAAAAVVYCRADAARLCLRCDRHVHAANSVSARHPRSLLCDACAAAPAAFLLPVPCSLRRRRSRSSRVLCSNCDFEAARRGGGRSLRVVERRAVESYSGCPSAAELAAMLGVGGDEKEVGRGVGGGAWWGEEEKDWAWAAAAVAAAEAAPVFSLEDLIVPTTSSHGFQALGTPPLPKSRDSTCGKRREEILRQLQELTKSEAVVSTVSEELEPVAEFQSWASEHAFQQGYAGPDIGGDVTNIVVPIYEDSKWNLKEYQNPTETLSMEFPYEQYPLKPAEGTVSSLVEISDICAGTSNGTVGDGSSGQAAGGKIAQILPTRVRHDLPCPDRGTVISRYKEKRKTRRYEKLIRYESRKARADSRLRIKGRFAKMNQPNND